MTSTQMKKIAREAAKIAAVQTYRAITNGTLTKKASTGTKVTTKDIAKAAATATYQSILRLAQQGPVYDFFAVSAKIKSILNTAGIATGEIDDSNPQHILVVQIKNPQHISSAVNILKMNAATIKGMGYTKPAINLYSTGNDDAQSVPMA